MVRESTTISNFVDDLAHMTIILATPNKINKQNPNKQNCDFIQV